MLGKARLENFLNLNYEIAKYQRNNMQSEVRQKMEKLNRAQKCLILGPQILGSRGWARVPAPLPGSAYASPPQRILNPPLVIAGGQGRSKHLPHSLRSSVVISVLITKAL